MQCTPVYYHARDVNAGASGYAWRLYDNNAGYGEERGHIISMPLCDQDLANDKEVLKQMIKKHEATFRYQVRELHRLYRRQRDLMDEMRIREIFAHNLSSRTSESIHSLSPNHTPATNWLFSSLASSKLSELTSGYVRGPTTLRTDSFTRKNSNNHVQFLSPSCNRNGNEIINLELQADMCHDQRKQFKGGNLSQAPFLACTPDEISILQAANDSNFGSIKTRDSSSSCSNIRKTNFFIDLNIPVQLESLPTSSYGSLEAFTGHNQTVCSEECVPSKAIPECVVPTRSDLLKSDDGSSDGVNLSMAIDLNSIPVNCYSETEMTLESPRSMNREAKVVMDYSSPCNRNKISDGLKIETYIDLNAGVEVEPYLPLSGSSIQIKPAEETELNGPVSPENEESSPPRGKSTPLSSEQGEGVPFIELEAIAAQTLVDILSSRVGNFSNLCWFAAFVSSTGDDQENKVMKLENDEGEEIALNLSHFSRLKGTGTMSQKKGQNRGKKHPPKKSHSKRKAGRNSSAKARKLSKSMSAILKQGWGTVRKRKGGRARRAINSFSLAQLTSF